MKLVKYWLETLWGIEKMLVGDIFFFLTIFVAFVEDNATVSSILYFKNQGSYFVQNRRKQTLLAHIQSV